MKDFHDKMREKIKMYSNQQYLDGYIKKEYYTQDGDADIYYHINSKKDLFDEHSCGEQISLDWELYDFLEEKTSMLGSDIPIHLHFKGAIIPSKDQELVRHIFKEHYAIELYKAQKKFKAVRNKVIKLIFAGSFFLFCYAMLYLFTELDFFKEVLGFLFSFSLWEAFHAFIYDLSASKLEREAVTQNLLTSISFEEDQTEYL